MTVVSVELIMQGTSYPLSYNASTGKYAASITAPTSSSFGLTGHYYPLKVRATDDAGNVTEIDTTTAQIGDALKLVVKERVAPTTTIISPAADAKVSTSAPVIEFNVMDADSGVDATSVVLKIDQVTIPASDLTSVSILGGIKFTYTPSDPLTDGAHQISVDASDNDGNVAVKASSAFTVDTTSPDLNVTAPIDGSAQASLQIAFAGQTNDLMSSPVTIAVKLDGGVPVNPTVGADGRFSGVIDVPETAPDGVHTLTITATDQIGNATTVTRQVTINRSAPVISNVVITPNPVETGQMFTITVTVTDA